MSQHVLSALDFFKSWFLGAGGSCKTRVGPLIGLLLLEEPKGTKILVEKGCNRFCCLQSGSVLELAWAGMSVCRDLVN